jgi:hypothetical protein
MTITSPTQLPLAMFKLIFEKKGFTYKGKTLNKLPQRGITPVQFGNFIYVEQSPNGKDLHALQARKGNKIMWIIDISTTRAIGKVYNGEIHKL